MSSHILHEREVARHNLRGRTFVVRRIQWSDDDRPSFDVDDVATGVTLTEVPFDQQPEPDDILALLERLLSERGWGTLSPRWADEQVLAILDDVEGKHTVRVHISDTHIVVVDLGPAQALTVEVDGREYAGVMVPDSDSEPVSVTTWNDKDNVTTRPRGSSVSWSPTATVIELRSMQDPLRALLRDYVRARAFQLAELSYDLTADYQHLVDDARGRASALGVPWADDVVPDHIWHLIAPQEG